MGKSDAFNDIRAKTEGIFAGSLGLADGQQDLKQIPHQIVKNGVAIDYRCQQCGVPHRIEVTWPEIIAIRCQISPQIAYGRTQNLQAFADPWDQMRDGTWIPHGFRCSKCGSQSFMGLVPKECARWIAKGRQNGWISPKVEQQLGTICVQHGGRSAV